MDDRRLMSLGGGGGLIYIEKLSDGTDRIKVTGLVLYGGLDFDVDEDSHAEVTNCVFFGTPEAMTLYVTEGMSWWARFKLAWRMLWRRR